MFIYIETNFLMSYAMGRDLATDRFFSDPPMIARLVLPSCCIMEALSALEGEARRREKLASALEAEVVQIRTNIVSGEARSLAPRLDDAVTDYRKLNDDFGIRMLRVIDLLARGATLIEPTASIVQSAFSRVVVDDPTDNLILACILAHAAEFPAEASAFLSENSRCFYKNPNARAALDGAGIKYFAEASKCLEWRERSPESKMEG